MIDGLEPLDIAPFYLYENFEQPSLDPVLAYCALVEDMVQYGLPLKGFVCRKRMNSGSMSADEDAEMVNL